MGKGGGAAEAVPSQNGDEDDEPDKKKMKPQYSSDLHDGIEMEEEQEPKDSGKASGSKDGIKPPEEEPEDEQEEAQEAKVRRAPVGPTKQEREAHEATNMPFRE